MMSVESARLAGLEGKPLRARKVVGSGMIGPLGARFRGRDNTSYIRSAGGSEANGKSVVAGDE
jgi:hypothetical protein